MTTVRGRIHLIEKIRIRSRMGYLFLIFVKVSLKGRVEWTVRRKVGSFASLSALSTTAIKDGHRGSAHPHQHGHTLSTNTLEAERADRISRLAGLERVATVRPGSQPGGSQGGASAIPGYFDAQGNPVYKSTVGSASATGSVGGRTTTWASGSVPGQTEGDDEDQMSMDTNFRDVDERDR